VVLDDGESHTPIATQKPIGTVLSAEKSEQNRRRVPRLNLSIPVHVTGHDRQQGKWREIAKTVNVSRFGLAVEMRARISQGTVVHLSLPLPVKLRNHGYSAASYNVYAIVRRVQRPKGEVRVVALELLGERPPAGYLEQPWAIFQTTKWLGVDRRREQRAWRTETVEIDYLDQDYQTIQSDCATTENISLGGMRIVVKAPPGEFDFIRVISRAGNCSGVAAVCNRYMGNDNRERLCLHFIDARWPL
jgi:hypothetical protein